MKEVFILDKQIIVQHLGLVKGAKLNKHLKELGESTEPKDVEMLQLIEELVSKLVTETTMIADDIFGSEYDEDDDWEEYEEYEDEEDEEVVNTRTLSEMVRREPSEQPTEPETGLLDDVAIDDVIEY